MNVTHSFLILLFGLATAYPAFAKAPVWKISKGNNSLFLGGTIHVLSPDDYPLPEAFDQAYRVADTLVFETDIAGMSNADAQLKMLQALNFMDERRLSTVLSTDSVMALTDFLQQRNLRLESFDRLTPAGLSLTLTVMELQRLGLGVTSGVDEFYTSRAKNDNKPLESLETIDQQIGFIKGMNEADPDEIVQSSLRDLAELGDMWRKLLTAWRTGNMDELETLALEPMEADYPEIAKLLVDDRNHNWMRVFPDMLADKDIEFVLVGSLHMVGEQGLITLLKQAGYNVEQLD